MKIKSFIYTAFASVLLFASCDDLNKPHVFDDATQAFIAFDGVSGNLNEAVEGVPGELELTLHCASVEGIDAEVAITTNADSFPTMPAYEGEHYVIERIEMYSIDYDQTSPTFNQKIDVVVADSKEVVKFNKRHRFASIYIKAVDNEEQGGDLKFDVRLTNVKGCKLGAHNRYTVTVVDDEDPINKLVGTYKASASSMFDSSPLSWDVTISRDAEDPTTLWINPACTINGASSYNSVYATVDIVNGTLAMPFGQTLYGSESSETYNLVIAGFDNQANPVLSGANIANIEIAESGTVTITWTEGFGVGNLVDNTWWWQAVADVTYVKQ